MSSSSDQLKYIQSLSEFPCGILALCPDAVRLRRLASHLLDLAADKTGLEKGEAVRRINGSHMTKASWNEIRDNLLSFSLFSNASLFLVEDCGKIGLDITKEIVGVLTDLPSSSKLIFTAPELPASNPIKKTLSQRKCLVELEALKGQELRRWIQKELKAAGFTGGDASSPDMVAELGDGSPDRISRIVELLSLYCEGGKLREEDIRDLFPDRVHPNEFHLLDHVMNGSEAGILRELTRLMNAGKSPLALLGLLNRNLSTLASIRVLQHQGLAAAAIRERLGLPEWLLKKHLGSASRLSLETVRNIFPSLLRADSKFKNYSLSDTEVLSELFEELAARR